MIEHMKFYQNSWLKTLMFKKETPSTGFNLDKKKNDMKRIRDTHSLSRNAMLSFPVPSRLLLLCLHLL